MTDLYKKVCQVTLKLKDAKDSLIKKTAVSMLPTLAYYDPVVFSELYLEQSMNHLVYVFRKTDEKRDGKISRILCLLLSNTYDILKPSIQLQLF
jgi:FKBP12-rapamycin complex-associated protein